MNEYNRILQLFLEGYITSAEAVERILTHFSDNPTSYKEVRAQLDNETLARYQLELDIDAQFLKDNF